MFRNYFKTALRNLRRNKVYAGINVAGLAVGIAACLLIFLVVRFETSYDTYHKNEKNIYRVVSAFASEDGFEHSPGVAFPAGPALKTDFPQLKHVARIIQSQEEQVTITNGNGQPAKKFTDRLYFTEPEFFSMFDFEWLAGDPQSTLTQPRSAVLSEAAAEKYFGNWKNAIGKTFVHENKYTYQVNGIIKNPPVNSDFPFQILVSYKSLEGTHLGNNLEDWVSTYSQHYTFVQLPAGYSPDKFNTELVAFVKKHKPAEYAKDKYMLQPLSEIHYDEEFGNYNARTFSHSLVTSLMLIAIFLVIIACVNFINLATAQAVNRAREVGVRKVMGSNRRQLAVQFLCETGIITFSALLLAVGITALVLPLLNQFLDVKITFNIIKEPLLILFILGVGLAVTFLSGIYPALILSGFNPITALKSKITTKMTGGISLRRALVVLQFAIAHILIIGTLVVMSQMNFFKKATLGFDKQAVVNVPIPRDSAGRSKIDVLRQELLQGPGIAQVSFSLATPAEDGGWQSDFKFDQSLKSTNWSANLKWADAEYFDVYKLQFAAGRPYANADTVREFVVNETLARKLGYTDFSQIIGKQIDFWDGRIVAPIVGVVRDFNSFSLREPMAPVVLGSKKNNYYMINARIKSGETDAALGFIERTWNKTYPDNVYEYSFMDKTVDEFYKQEAQLSTLYKIFAGIAIFISCLGLYGLVSFMAAQRTREVGIRKVLGASSRTIVYLLSKEFTVLIFVAFVIAGPIAWFIMKNWLQNYSYRVPMGISIFVAAIIGSILIAWMTVGYRAIKSALANPVKSLRTE
ncbi:MAG TPA: ABC transporter permease [Chitinophagaceae bacterium]|nr:ABC transporter permease [Chitinophagaceae bacterium]